MTRFDKHFENLNDFKKILNKIFTYELELSKEADSEMYLICLDLKRIIKGMKLKHIDRRILNLWLKGYNEPQIAKRVEKYQQNVHRSILRMCKRISEEFNND